MKKVLASSVVVLMVLFLSAGFGLAGNGQGGGSGGGTGPIHDILSGTPFDITGDVFSIVPGGGVEIAPAEGDNVIIYGIGPVRYWDSLGGDRLLVGDAIEVTGYTVDYNGVLRNIAMGITIDGVMVELRDPDTGVPLWRRSGGNSN